MAPMFANQYKLQGDEVAGADFAALLSDLKHNFTGQTDKILLDNRSDVNFEIKVLRDRLQRHGM
ncbi:MAG: hypothetical protein OSA51_00230 [Octadecabacter sp.]|nr:hypothetical protein [Octadecabacter sp.]